jgi:uncharacterized protein
LAQSENVGLGNGVLTEEMKQVVVTEKIGYVATVCEDGTPNLSPKSTFIVLDESRIAFANIRSPNTVRNITRQPIIEVNFISIFARKGYRFKGPVAYWPRMANEFAELLPLFEQRWGALCAAMKGIFVLTVECALPLTSPVYDFGATEDETRAKWMAYFEKLNKG